MGHRLSWAARLLALGFALVACASLPTAPPRPRTVAFTDTAETPLGRLVASESAAHPGRSAAHALIAGREAFAARHALAQAAQRSIDVQYYIWHADVSGALLARALWDAAERGVRVRMLLDDINTKGLDPLLATLDAHPNIEVRLFNPFANRGWRMADYLSDFSRVNRRMHNKSFTVDNQASVVGGRNVGDEYLGADTAVAFTDLDVLVAGPVVREISDVFDRYWNSEVAYPAASIVPQLDDAARAGVRRQLQEQHDTAQVERYLESVRRMGPPSQMLAGPGAIEWVPARLVFDPPEKVLNPPERKDLHMLPRLTAALGRPEHELLLVSPYFVPGEEGTQALLALAQRGVRIQILTNSLAATDVGPVYAGYSRYRKDLLRGGVRIFELAPAALPPGVTKDSDRGPGGSGGGGSSGASLHAKTFAVDRERIFVGSFNLDPRSARLNTEMGVVLESRRLASALGTAFDREVPRSAYEVRLAPGSDSLEWIERTEAGEVRHTSTPGVGPLRMLWIGMLAILPIEWLL